MDQSGTIQALGIRIANDAIMIASLEAQVAELRNEVSRLQADSPSDESA